MRAAESPTSAPIRRRALGFWIAFVGACIWIAARSNYVADLSAFLPSAPTAEQRVLLDQVHTGIVARLVLIGIEGGDTPARAAASRQLATSMRASGLFDSVNNGDNAGFEQTGRFLFEHRYLLSPAVDAERFSVAGLRAAIDDTVALLGTPAGALVKPILLRDPTGETVRIAESMLPTHAPRSDGGVWVSRSAARAVLVATTHAEGADLDAQQRALEFIHASFAPQAARGLTVATSGAGTFGVESRARIKAEVERLAIAGSALIVVLLLVAFGSLRSLAIAVLPVATGVLAGIAAVSLCYGQVHAVTLGFGTTLIGEAVDYAIYYLIQARAGARGAAAGAAASATSGGATSNTASHTTSVATNNATSAGTGSTAGGARHWLVHSWPTVRLGLLTSLCGFAALVFSGFPGLAQLGVYSIAGLAAAALGTRYVFPILAPNGAPGGGLRRHLGRFTERCATLLPSARVPLLIVALGALLTLWLLPSPWRGDLSSLSPMSAAQLDYDAQLRADVGAPDTGTLVALTATDEAHALAAAEAAGVRLDKLVAQGLLTGYESPAHLLPSPATQAARRAALPDAATLTARLDAATVDGPLAASRLGGFIADVQAARSQPIVDRAALNGTALATAIDAFLVRGADGKPWRVFLNLQAGGADIDLGRVRAALAGLPGAQVINISHELGALYARYLHQAMLQAIFGAVAVCVLLAWHLRSPRRLLQVAEPVAASVVIVLAGLAASGAALGILHLVGLLLVVAIGSNYALFFDHLRERGRADEDTLASLALANLTTVCSFGLLASSGIPALHSIGIVVAPGALLCLLLSAAFIGTHEGRGVRGKMPAPRAD
ncbi:MAG: transporter [Caldimonas sp.]